jgi:hypothetical protein
MSTKILKINRGDSFEFTITMPTTKNSTEPYMLKSSDAVYFALMWPNQRIDEAIIAKGYTLEDQDVETGNISVKLTPYDTRYLTPGIYYYTVKLQIGGSLADMGATEEPDEVKTLVERTKFIVNE